MLAPDVPAYCPTGTFPDNDGFTFFRRDPDFGIPEEDLLALARDAVLPGGFVSACGSAPLLLLGYSSGAIFATALLAVAPRLFVGAILLRPQVIAEDFVFPDLSQKSVLIISGLQDIRRRPEHATRLAEQLSAAGATVTHHAIDAGHASAQDDSELTLARAWMASASGSGDGPA